MSDDVAAEWVGSASTPGGIASELAVACEALRTVDYNALSPEELGEALDAFEDDDSGSRSSIGKSSFS
jgi:hypothetical protein